MKGLCELDEVKNAPPVENLLLVDCLNFAFRFKHRSVVDFAAEFVTTIGSFAKSYSARTIILLADKKYSKYRKDIDPEYKGGRKKIHENQTDEAKEQARVFFEGYERAIELAKSRYPLLRIEYVEADDLAAYIVKEYSHMYNHTWLISSDGDWDLLLAENVSRFSFVTRKEYTIDNFYDHHECDNPEEFLSIKVLQGDISDSIPGVPGVGIKRAYNLIREYGSAVDIHDSIPLAGKQKFIENLNASADLIMKNYELIDLVSHCEDAIVAPDGDNLRLVMDFCEENLS